jgi:signal transduction histidine kinase
MSREVSDSEHVFQTAAWMWLVYLAAIAGVDAFIYANQPAGPILVYYLANGLPALLFCGLAYSGWLKKYADTLALLMTALITAAPTLINYAVNIHLPPAPLSNLEGMVLRQIPVLIIALVLVAWQYNLVTIILYSLGTNLLEIGIVFGFALLTGERLTAFFFIIVIRTVCLIVVGIFVNQLVTRLRAQQKSLREANLQLAHYASTLEDLTISRERNRMSRELHDTVVHTLSGLSVQLETAKAYLDIQPGTAGNLLDQALEATRSGLQETRRAIKSLRASPLDDLGLIKAIQAMTETAAQRGRLSVDLSLPDHDPVLSPDIEQCLYRVCQEALENVVHHANAQHLCVLLEIKEGAVALEIQDDGAGFDASRNHLPGHYGLGGMKERAALAGGELTITSRLNSGTRVGLLIKGLTQ